MLDFWIFTFWNGTKTGSSRLVRRCIIVEQFMCGKWKKNGFLFKHFEKWSEFRPGRRLKHIWQRVVHSNTINAPLNILPTLKRNCNVLPKTFAHAMSGFTDIESESEKQKMNWLDFRALFCPITLVRSCLVFKLNNCRFKFHCQK